MIIDSAKKSKVTNSQNGRWIIPFKKLGMVRVKKKSKEQRQGAVWIKNGSKASYNCCEGSGDHYSTLHTDKLFTYRKKTADINKDQVSSLI